MARLMKRSFHFALWIGILVIVAGCNLNNNEPTSVITGTPVVRIVSPQANAAYLQGVTVNVQAQVTNAGADIDRVEIALDDGILETISAPNTDGAEAFAVGHSWTASGVGEHRIAVTAFRKDGSASDPALVTISVVNTGDVGAGSIGTDSLSTDSAASAVPSAEFQTGGSQATHLVLPSLTPSPGPTQSVQTAQPPTQPSAATATSQPTAIPPTSGDSGTPTASFAQGTNVRRGPGLDFDPPIGAFSAGQSTEILAANTDGQWYKVRYGGGEGWVNAGLVTTTGNLSSLPRDPGPPHPTPRPITATPILPTQQPVAQSGANLVAGIVVLNPSSPVCSQTFTVGLDVANLGTQPTSASGTVSLVDVRASDGTVQGQTVGGFPTLQPGQTFRVDMPLTVSTWYNETHRITLTIDQENLIPESNPNDNAISIEYTLNKGDCP